MPRTRKKRTTGKRKSTSSKTVLPNVRGKSINGIDVSSKNRAENIRVVDYSKVNSQRRLPLEKDKKEPVTKKLTALEKKADKSMGIRKNFSKAVRSVIKNYHQEYIEKYPQDFLSYERKAYMFYQDGSENNSQAIEYLTKAIELGANSAKVWHTLGKCYYTEWRHNNSDWNFLWKAKAAYQKAMQFIEVSTNPMALFELAKTLEGLGDIAGAIDVIHTIVRSFPNFSGLSEVLYRAGILLLYHAMLMSNDLIDSGEQLEAYKKCTGYAKEVVDKQISNGDQYIDVVYFSARSHELLGDNNSMKHSVNAYKELYRICIKSNLFEAVNGGNWSDWYKELETWLTWVKYFSRKNENILAIDAQNEALKRCVDSKFSNKTFSWEPQATLHYNMALLYYKCNKMDKATEHAEQSLSLAPYSLNTRRVLLEWYSEKWKSIQEQEYKAQVSIAKILRGNWGRDKLIEQRNRIIDKTVMKFEIFPYNLRIRKTLILHCKAKYAARFAAENLAAITVQKIARIYLRQKRLRSKRRKLLEDRIASLERKLKRKDYDYETRKQLLKLLPSRFADLYRKQEDASCLIQRCTRGMFSRKYYRKFKISEQARRKINEERNLAAIRIQRQYRRVQSNVLLRSQRYIKNTRLRLSINLQRLYRAKKNYILLVSRQKIKRKKAEESLAIRSRSAAKIQLSWRRYLAKQSGENFNEADFFLQNLKRGREAIEKVEEDLDYHARKIQALYRGRKDRLCLVGLKRIQEKPQICRVCQLQEQCLLRHQQKLEILSIADPFNISLNNDIHLIPRLFENNTIICQNSTGVPFSDRDAFILAKHLQKNKNVHTLILTQGNIGCDGLLHLVSALLNNRGLRRLAIGPNNIEEDTPWCAPLESLSKCLQRRNFQLRELIIEDNSLLNTGAIHIAQVIGDYFFGRYGFLTTLVLARIGMSDVACEHFGEALTINRVLISLDLNGNTITDAGVVYLSQGLEKNSTLKKLNLSDNRFGSDGGKAIASFLVRNSAMEEIHLCNNNMKNDCFAAFRNAVLNETTKLLVLNIGGNLFHQDNLEELQTLLDMVKMKAERGVYFPQLEEQESSNVEMKPVKKQQTKLSPIKLAQSGNNGTGHQNVGKKIKTTSIVTSNKYHTQFDSLLRIPKQSVSKYTKLKPNNKQKRSHKIEPLKRN